MLTRRDLLRRAGGFGLLAATGGLLAACGSGGTTTSTGAGGTTTSASAATASAATASAAAGTPVSGGTLTLITPATIAAINPVHEADWNTDQSLYNMFDPLLTYDTQNKPLPLIATSWSASTDAKTFTFKIRKGMKFQDGTPCDANALKANMAWYGDPANKAPLYGNFFTDLSHVDAPDPETFVIVMKVPKIPDNFFPDFLFGPLIASPTAFANASAFNTHPVGSGPFAFDSYVADNHLRLKRFDGYWGGKPYLDYVDVKIITDQATQLDQMLAGAADFQFGVPPQNVSTLKGKGIIITAGVSPGEQMLSINLNNPILADLNVRKAIAYALDRNAIIQKVLYGYATPAVALVPPNSPQFDKSLTGYGYDPAKAKQILASDGWVAGSDGVLAKGGQQLALNMATQTDPTWLLICQIVQQELKQIGIKVTIHQTDWPTFLSNMRAGSYDIAYWSLGGFTFSGISYTANLESTQYWNVSQMTKNAQFKTLSQQFDTVIKTAQSAIDPTKYLQLCFQFQKMVIDNLPVVPLWHTQNISAMQPWVHGLIAPTQYQVVRAEKAWKSQQS
jgi:ABC-type transport system substrate-binding protein